MNMKYPLIAAGIACLACIAAFRPVAFAQEQQTKKIPYEVIEGQPSDAGIDEPSARRPAHRMALGVNIDLFPTVLSAADRQFGLGIQPWFGVDSLKIRLDIAHLRVPNDLVATRYFYRNNVNLFALVFEYTFGRNFDGFLVGAGIGMWQDSVSPRYYGAPSTAVRPFIAIEGGYIWEFYKNLYIEPCLALDIMLTRTKMTLFRCGYAPLPLAGEFTLKFGMYIDI